MQTTQPLHFTNHCTSQQPDHGECGEEELLSSRGLSGDEVKRPETSELTFARVLPPPLRPPSSLGLHVTTAGDSDHLRRSAVEGTSMRVQVSAIQTSCSGCQNSRFVADSALEEIDPGVFILMS